jgi:hypothetical protein
MPEDPFPSQPESTRTETTDDPLAARDTPAPEQPQPGSPVIPAVPGELERSSLSSLLDATSRTTVPENTVVNNTPPSPRTADNHGRDTSNSSTRRPIRTVIPDPITAAPNAPRVVVHRTNGNQRRLSVAGHVLAFFGYGRNNKARKELVSIIWTLVVDFSQVILVLSVSFS